MGKCRGLGRRRRGALASWRGSGGASDVTLALGSMYFLSTLVYPIVRGAEKEHASLVNSHRQIFLIYEWALSSSHLFFIFSATIPQSDELTPRTQKTLRQFGVEHHTTAKMGFLNRIVKNDAMKRSVNAAFPNLYLLY
jgi:hypothetical protein